jgi:nanoRNase/pAp phosphatase (c-di-AMP/oligoRNAs hydrolase)
VADINPKQQAQELIKQSNYILLVSGHNLTDDQYCSVLAMKEILNKIGKSVTAISGSNLPKIKECFAPDAIVRDFDGARDLVVDIDTNKATVDTVKYDLIDDKLRITVRAKEGALKTSAIHGHYGAYLFDLVIAIGVADFSNIDNFVTKDPSIFDGIHLINVDYHRTNSSFGSVNIIDTNASSVSEMMVALAESLGYGPLGSEIASMLFAGIIANTNRFANKNTTAKAMTMAAQMLAAGARHNEIIKVLSGSSINSKDNNQSRSRITHNASGGSFKQNDSRDNSQNPDNKKHSFIKRFNTLDKPEDKPIHKAGDDDTTTASSKIEKNNASHGNTDRLTDKMSDSSSGSTMFGEVMKLDNSYPEGLSDSAISLEQEMKQSSPVAHSSENQENSVNGGVGLDINSSDLDQFLSLKTK